jgi:hypothetical protein
MLRRTSSYLAKNVLSLSGIKNIFRRSLGRVVRQDLHQPQIANTRIRYMEKGKYEKAFDSLCRLRKHKLQAARDMYYAYKLIEVEAAEREGRNPWKEFFCVRHNRRAAQSAFFVMFTQQFCGVNVSDAGTLSRLDL